MNKLQRIERSAGMNVALISLSVWFVATFFGTAGCSSEVEERISPAVRLAPAPLPQKNSDEPLRFAIGSMISPAATYNIYEDILRHVAQEAGRSFSFVQRRSYQETNDLLVSGQIDLAFICSGAFASLPQDASVELLAVPVVHGAPTYYSFIIARSESDITQLTDLKDKSFAFTDPLSNTGYFYPLARLGDIGTTPAAFFSDTILTGSHDRSITAVYRKLADAAAVDSLVYEHLVIPGSRYFGELKVIESSPGFPIPPFVSPTSVAPELRRSFRQSLLQLHTSPEGRELLKAIEVERFVDGDPSSYKLIEAYADRAQRALKQ